MKTMDNGLVGYNWLILSATPHTGGLVRSRLVHIELNCQRTARLSSDNGTKTTASKRSFPVCCLQGLQRDAMSNTASCDFCMWHTGMEWHSSACEALLTQIKSKRVQMECHWVMLRTGLGTWAAAKTCWVCPIIP